jgi:hypothetical protein
MKIYSVNFRIENPTLLSLVDCLFNYLITKHHSLFFCYSVGLFFCIPYSFFSYSHKTDRWCDSSFSLSHDGARIYSTHTKNTHSYFQGLLLYIYIHIGRRHSLHQVSQFYFFFFVLVRNTNKQQLWLWQCIQH